MINTIYFLFNSSVFGDVRMTIPSFYYKINHTDHWSILTFSLCRNKKKKKKVQLILTISSSFLSGEWGILRFFRITLQFLRTIGSTTKSFLLLKVFEFQSKWRFGGFFSSIPSFFLCMHLENYFCIMNAQCMNILNVYVISYQDSIVH